MMTFVAVYLAVVAALLTNHALAAAAPVVMNAIYRWLDKWKWRLMRDYNCRDCGHPEFWHHDSEPRPCKLGSRTEHPCKCLAFRYNKWRVVGDWMRAA
jgi:hypothetical protein